MTWLLGGYMWLFIHRPFEVWPSLQALHVERVYIIVTLAYWALAADKRWIANRMTAALVALAAVVLLSDVFSPFGLSMTPVALDWFKVLVFYFLVLSTVRSEKDLQRLIVMFVAIMGLYMAHSAREYLCGRHVYRMGTLRMIGIDASYSDPNTFSATILYSLPLLWPLWKQAVRPWHRWLLAGYLGLAATCIMLTGSRSGLVGLACGLFLAAWAFRLRRVVVVLALAAMPLAWVSLRGDLKDRFLTLIDPSRGPKNAQESAVGRIQGWHDGVRLWGEHPVLGAGAGHFARARGINTESHQLYGQVLGELGTLGAIAFAGVVLAFVANWRRGARLCRAQPGLRNTFPAQLSLAITLTVPLLLVMGLGGHNLYRYTWVWYAAFQVVALKCLVRRARAAEWLGHAGWLGQSAAVPQRAGRGTADQRCASVPVCPSHPSSTPFHDTAG